MKIDIENRWKYENRFNEDLKSKLDSTEKLDYPLFESIFIDVLNTLKEKNELITNSSTLAN